ncbi:MAG: hypothetical protein M3460_23495 [Actinomycetota bacterium]|nr:hypothetical protein [Actinomycetota bacterium]
MSVTYWLIHRVCPYVMALVRGDISSWPGWPEHCRRTRCVGEQAVFPGALDPLQIRLASRDIGVDPLATQLVIDRYLAHVATP